VKRSGEAAALARPLFISKHPPARPSEVLEHANELRVMLCKDKVTTLPDGTYKRGTQVVAACGIYVSDILDAVPIDKVGGRGGGEGGRLGALGGRCG
jgi:hypothetical protein